MLAKLFVALCMKNKGKTMNLETKLNRDSAIDFAEGINNLLQNIKADYANWKGVRATPDRVDDFGKNLNVKTGRKFTKVIEKNRVWGFVANGDGVLKGIPYFKGDVFKPASWKAPAKHVRGSIFDTNTDWFSWTGPNYL